MKVSDFLRSMADVGEVNLQDEVLLAAPDDPLEPLATKLSRGRDLLAIYVLDDRRPVGVIVKDDLLTRVYGAGRDASKLTCSDVMSSNLRVVSAEADFDETIDRFLELGYLTQPVVGEDGFLLGVLTIFDVAKHLHEIYKLM
ncbi:MAG: hypothetical protein Kow0069_38080 [Promethearchaeota archaeon]